jgi:hypothetical protein
MDVQDIEAGSFIPGICNKVYCRCNKASSGSKAGTHRLSVCKSCMNLLLHEDNVMKSHLVRYDFVKDYTV